MSAVTAAVQAVLAGDAALISQLASYEGAPAIFTALPIPVDAPFPCVVTAGNLADVAEDTLTRRGRRITRDVAVYFPRTGSEAAVEDAAERIRVLFHKQPLSVAGFHHVMTLASGPLRTPDEGDEVGRVVTLQIVLQEE